MPSAASERSSAPSWSVSLSSRPDAGSSSSSTRGPRRERAGDLDEAGLTGRQLVDAVVDAIAETDAFDDLRDFVALWRSCGAPRRRRSTFSRTDSSANSSRRWNVRAMPRRARLYGASELRSRPPRRTRTAGRVDAGRRPR